MADINGKAIALILAGGVFTVAAVRGKSVAGTTRAFVTGNDPNKAPTQDAITPASSGDGNFSDTGIITGTPATNRATAKLLAAPYGWATGNQWTALDSLWSRESSWSNTATNPSSGAFGIAQALPPSKYPKAGQPASAGGSASATTQIAWGLSYIRSRYGDPVTAWAHELANGWY